MATVILCDKCDKRIHTKPHVWHLAETTTTSERDVDLCEECWKQLSWMVWDKVLERLREHAKSMERD